MNKVINYSKREIFYEIGRIVEETKNTNTTLGESLYMQTPFFANPKILWSDSYNDWINKETS